MQVAVGPAHDYLNDVMKPVQRDAGGHHETSPDGRLEINRRLELFCLLSQNKQRQARAEVTPF